MDCFQAIKRTQRRKQLRAIHSWAHVISVWLRRYLPAEVASLMCALVGGTLAATLTNAEAIVAAVSAWSAVVGYYGVLLACEVTHQSSAGRRVEVATLGSIIATSVRTLVLEFGGAEALDSLLFSPMLTYVCIHALPNLQLAITVSELASSIIFYSLVIVARALRYGTTR